MNANTRISVHCYAGDGRQVNEMLPHHLLHGFPITLLSPDNSRVEITQPGVDSKFAGQQQSIGQLSIVRQREQLKLLLEYPEEFFLMHDADSICLSPTLPQYLYDEPDVMWSNVVWIEDQGERSECDKRRLPHVACQPPYFTSRRTIQKLLDTNFPYHNHFDGFIDHHMTQAAVEAGVVWKGFHGGISCALSMNNNELQRAQVRVRHTGSIFVHGVKTPRFWQPLVEAHKKWLDDYRPVGDSRPMAERVTTAGVKPADHEYVRSTMAADKITYHRTGDAPPGQATRGPRNPLQHQHRHGGVKA
jgi:hypothetical protein